MILKCLLMLIYFGCRSQEDCLIISDFITPSIDWDTHSAPASAYFESAIVDAVDELLLTQHILTPTRFRIGQQASL